MTVTAPSGFRAEGVAAGIKSSGELDLALLVNDGPERAAAGRFTRNKLQAAPVLWSQQVLTTGQLRGVVVNSGGANACTGPQGFQTTHATAERAAEVLSCGAAEIAVCSVGRIGTRLPREAVLAGIDAAALGLSTSEAAATRAATAVLAAGGPAVQVRHESGAGWLIGGLAHGPVAAAPSVATMLAVLTTDAVAEAADLDAALRAAAAETFDQLDAAEVSSPNDSVLLLSSGASGVAVTRADLTFALTGVCARLAAQLRGDEAGSGWMTVSVRGAATEAEALALARRVARDSALKEAFAASDPDWGRVAAVAGDSEAALDPHRLEILLNGHVLCQDGEAAGEPPAGPFGREDIAVEIDLHLGDGCARLGTTGRPPGHDQEKRVGAP